MALQTTKTTLFDNIAAATQTPKDPLQTHPTATMEAKEPEWSSRVVGSTSRTDLAVERDHKNTMARGRFTAELTKLLNDDPSLTYDQALDIVSDMNFGDDSEPQYAGQTRAGNGKAAEGKRRFGLIICNSDYPEEAVSGMTWPDLKTAGDAWAMASTLSGRGYDFTKFGVHFDQTAHQMALLLLSVTKAKLGGGDVVAIHFSGHGSKQGLVGVDGRYMPSLIASLTTMAQAQGWQLRVTLDACFSGDTVRDASRSRTRIEKAMAGKGTKRRETATDLLDFGEFIDKLEGNAVRFAKKRLIESYNASYFGKGGDPITSLPRADVLANLRSDPSLIREWWKDIGWESAYWSVEALDNLPGGPFSIPNHDSPVNYDMLLDRLEQTYDTIQQAVGTTQSDAKVKQQLKDL